MPWASAGMGVKKFVWYVALDKQAMIKVIEFFKGALDI
jgi:hypothetical protein